MHHMTWLASSFVPRYKRNQKTIIRNCWCICVYRQGIAHNHIEPWGNFHSTKIQVCSKRWKTKRVTLQNEPFTALTIYAIDFEEFFSSMYIICILCLCQTIALWRTFLFRQRINLSPHSAVHMRQWVVSTLVQIQACGLFGVKPLSKPMLGYSQLDH